MKTLILIIINILSLSVFAFADPKTSVKPENLIEKTSTIKKQITRDEYKLPAGDPNSESKVKLNNLIEELNALTFQQKVIKPDVNQLPDQPADANQLSDPNNDTAEIFKLDENFKPDPNTVIELVDLADVLYKNKLYENAALYYKKSLEKIQADTESSPNKKSWVLFQLANCLKNQNPTQALIYYEKLVKEFPSSQWAEIAVAQKNVLRTVIEEKNILISNKDKGI